MVIRAMKNSALSAKVHAMTGKALTNRDYDAMMALKSVPAIALYLIENTNYADAFCGISAADIHRAKLERLLREHLRADIKRLIPFMSADAKKFTEITSLGEGIEKIKICLRLIKIGNVKYITEYINQIPLGNIAPSDMQNLEGVDDFIELLKDTPYFKVLSVFKGRPDRQKLFRMETALDTFWAEMVHKYAKKYLKGDEVKSVLKVYGTDFDLQNLAFMLRCKKNFEMTDDEIYASIIPKHYRLTKGVISKIVKSGSYEEAVAIIEAETPYGQAFSKTDRFIEKRQEEYLTLLQKHMANANQYSIQSPVCYIHLRRTETNNIVSIVEGIRYGLPPEKIKEYLIGYRLNTGGAEI